MGIGSVILKWKCIALNAVIILKTWKQIKYVASFKKLERE